MNKTVFSFTEEFIARRTGKYVDFKKLLFTFSTICPLEETCGVDYENRFLFSEELFPSITGCNRCTCNPSCIYSGNCCPGTHYGYFDYSCFNINLYPQTTEEASYMVGTCIDNYNENKTVIELCREKFEPCTGTESSLIYKNKYCGECNKEIGCISLKIEVECADAMTFKEVMPSFSSLLDMKKALDSNNCRIRFQLPNDDPTLHCKTSKVEYLKRATVDRCNVSGSWEIYDEDIDWACSNFITPYRNFKNIFCYICNPSHSKVQAESLIDKCRPARNRLETEVNKACETFSVADRLAPFKNIYCYVCSQGYDMLFDDNEYSLQYANEFNTINLQTRLDIAIKFAGEQKLNDFKIFVENVLSETFEVKEDGNEQCKSKQLINEYSDIKEAVNGYKSICGTETLCNTDITRNNIDKAYGNPVCKSCDCDSFCAENRSCCPDILLTRVPYSCYSHGMFSSFHKGQDEGSKYVLNISSNISKTDFYLTIDRCLNDNDTPTSLLEGEKFIRKERHPSQFEFKVETDVTFNSTTALKPVRNVFDKCNKTGMYRYGKSDLIRNICETEDENLMALLENRIDNNVYKNFACFLCNPEHDVSADDSDKVTSRCLSNNSVDWYVPDETLEELCNETEFHPRWYPYKNMYCAECNLPPWQLVVVNVLITDGSRPPVGYKYIFSLSSADFEHLDMVTERESIPECIRGTYDYTLKRCRSLSCNDGFHLFNTTCKPILESAIQHQYTVSFDLHYSSEDNINMYGNNETNGTVIVYLETLFTKIEDIITTSFGETTEYFIKSKGFLISPCESINQDFYVDLDQTNTFNIELIFLIIKTETLSMVHTTLVNAQNRQFVISDIQSIDGLQKTIIVHSKPKVKNTRDIPDFRPCPLFQAFFYPELDSLQFNEYTIDPFFICGQITLNMSEVYLDKDSNNISLKNMNATFSIWEYKVTKKTVIICADVYNTRTYIEPAVVMLVLTDHVKSVIIIFSFVCTIVSLLCLFLTFLTYSFLSTLRTVAGKNIMSLCISLFFSQALLQFGINATQIAAVCVAIGISMHLSWLASFCAMNICSFHTFKVFCFNNFENRPANNKSDTSLFLKYSLYMICLPLFLVLANISASLIKSDASDIGYGEYYCFISDFYIFIFTFITPASFILLSNIIFFSMAFHQIRSTPSVQHTQDRNNFYICLRLCTIVGIAWPLLIIDNSFGITWFSFIAAGVNALQGVFIFVSFVVNRRVALMFLSTMTGSENTSTDTTGTKSSLRCYRVKIAETT
ncbi:uncharacterized protein LOC128550604 [Mercenaria mercenaria]|uniref:uncharacterized protein LOC128550604 n=1 Tax=Mercenaria mercenaria TaxID=6596 RepID=UPI00234E7FFD|nr:uncharacterized protein LOC128550604 [Mercenaria mercenaria]